MCGALPAHARVAGSVLLEVPEDVAAASLAWAGHPGSVAVELPGAGPTHDGAH